MTDTYILEHLDKVISNTYYELDMMHPGAKERPFWAGYAAGLRDLRDYINDYENRNDGEAK